MLAPPFCICIGVDATRFPHIQVDDSTQKYKLVNTYTVIGSGESIHARQIPSRNPLPSTSASSVFKKRRRCWPLLFRRGKEKINKK